jgi:hypothetical protein
MSLNKGLAWAFIAFGTWFLVSGIAMNDMGGIVAVGADPLMPVSSEECPGRFISGLLIYGGMLAGGIRMLRAKKKSID